MLSIFDSFKSFIKRRTTDAKASFTSNKSISLIVILALFKDFIVAGAGPVNIIVGSVEQVANDRIRALGFRPICSPISFEPKSVKDAPSTIPDEFPAV